MPLKHILITVAFSMTFWANVGLAQGWYLSANVGYGFGAGTQTIGYNTTNSGTTSSSEGVYGSFGEGFKFGASAGYMATRNLGTDLGFSYWLGKTFDMTDNSTGVLTTKASGSGFVAVPSIVLSADMNTIDPYARLGLVFAIVKVTQEMNYSYTGQTYDKTVEESGNLAFGFAGAFGILVPSSGTVGFFAEVTLCSVTYSPSQTETTKYTVNGVDQLSTITPKVVEYKSSNSSSDQNTALSVRRPFSFLGINAGVRINL